MNNLSFSLFSNDFDAFRRIFNRYFKLSVNGRFHGLLYLSDKLPLFVHRLCKMFSRNSRYSRCHSWRFVLNVKGFRCVLYSY